MVQHTVHGTARYLVELHAPDAGWKDVDLLIRRAREATNAGSDARFVRAIFLPEDSSFLLLYEAASGQEAAAAASALEFEVERVSQVLSTGVEHLAVAVGIEEPE